MKRDNIMASPFDPAKCCYALYYSMYRSDARNKAANELYYVIAVKAGLRNKSRLAMTNFVLYKLLPYFGIPPFGINLLARIFGPIGRYFRWF